MGEPRKLPLFERAEQFADRIAVRAELASAACYNMCQLRFSYPSSRECHGPANPIPQIACGPDTYTYRDLLTAASTIAGGLLGPDGVPSGPAGGLAGARVCYLVPPGFEYVAVQWGIWAAGGVAVPLGVMHPLPELKYAVLTPGQAPPVGRMSPRGGPHALAMPTRGSISPATLCPVEDLSAAALVTHPDFRAKADALREAYPNVLDSQNLSRAAVPAGVMVPLPVAAVDPAMILYTSGTTSKPKAWEWVAEVRLGPPHQPPAALALALAASQATMECCPNAPAAAPIVTAYAQDRILHLLPLHHIHGIINKLSCALWSLGGGRHPMPHLLTPHSPSQGATVEFLPGGRFDPKLVFERIASGDLSLFMAVPTVYSKLITAFNQAPAEDQQRYTAGCKNLRLMMPCVVSGSAALPVTTLTIWEGISGHTLLERYGHPAPAPPPASMTEIGMCLSNPLHGKRRPGHVGTPLPGQEVRRVDDGGNPAADDVPGEVQVRGPLVFKEYWNRPEATMAAFADGWFKTGDITVSEDGSLRILGRSSVDIIKTGGYK
eukprot:gene2762-3390_t